MLTFILFLCILFSKGNSISLCEFTNVWLDLLYHICSLITFVLIKHFSLLIKPNGLAFVNFKLIIVIEGYPSHIYSFLCISYKY